jgi:LacI family transcriptional regulator
MANCSITQAAVAKALGLAQSTVSMALRDHPSISKATREEIQTAARNMGYQPNYTAASLARLKRKGLRGSVAWFNFWTKPERLRQFREFDLYWEGATAAAAELGYRIEEYVVNTPALIASSERILRARGVEGILLSPGCLPVGWDSFNWAEFSVIRFSGPSHETEAAFRSITSNQFGNTLLAMERMRERGYQRIGFVGLEGTARLFGAGFYWGLREVPEENRLPILLLPDTTEQEWQIVFENWLREAKPDAILTDVSLLPRLLAKTGHRFPQEIGMATLNVLDCPIDAGIFTNPREVGYTAMNTLGALIETRTLGIPKNSSQLLIDGAWVDGSSLPLRTTGEPARSDRARAFT